MKRLIIFSYRLLVFQDGNFYFYHVVQKPNKNMLNKFFFFSIKMSLLKKNVAISSKKAKHY